MSETIHHIGENFERHLVATKGGLIVLLIAVSVFYQLWYTAIESNKLSKTLFNSDRYMVVAADAGTTAFCGALSTYLIMRSRGSISYKTVGIVAFILALFAGAQELSGMNRWLSKEAILNRKGIYSEIDDITEEDLARVRAFEDGGDPFIKSFAYFGMVALVITVLYAVGRMMYITRQGYQTGTTYIGNNRYGFIPDRPNTSFLMECLILGGLNAIPPLLSPVFRGEKITSTTKGMAFVTALISMSLQLMFQYVGMLRV